MCEKGTTVNINNAFNGTLVTFIREDEEIGKIKFSIDRDDNQIVLWSWKSKKGYGRKILMCLISTLLQQKLITKNFDIVGFIEPIKYKNKTDYNIQMTKLKNLYIKMGFNINQNGFITQKIHKLKLKNRVPFGNITSSFQ